jgi:hypothetical protein
MVWEKATMCAAARRAAETFPGPGSRPRASATAGARVRARTSETSRNVLPQAEPLMLYSELAEKEPPAAGRVQTSACY